MLWSIKGFREYHIHASDGYIGKVEDMLFDDHQWVVRHAVVDTGHWLPGRTVLIPPAALGHPDPAAHALPVALTRKQVEDSPPISTDEPVSRRHELRLYEFYGLQPYWVGGITGGAFPPPIEQAEEFEDVTKPPAAIAQKEPEGDPNLRSSVEVIGYHLQARDDELGHVADFIVDERGWVIRYVVADTRNWLPGRKVLVAVDWVKKVSWDESKVFVDLSRQEIADSPEWDPDTPVTREYEEALFKHYGRPGYWM